MSKCPTKAAIIQGICLIQRDICQGTNGAKHAGEKETLHQGKKEKQNDKK